jgi:hypothetical protein
MAGAGPVPQVALDRTADGRIVVDGEDERARAASGVAIRRHYSSPSRGWRRAVKCRRSAGCATMR